LFGYGAILYCEKTARQSDQWTDGGHWLASGVARRILEMYAETIKAQ